MTRFLQSFKMDMTDPELMRAQFRSFRWHVPLLYGILIANTLAITFTSFDLEQQIKTILSPAAICALTTVRAIWWIRQKNPQDLTDEAIGEHLKRTCRLAVLMTLVFNAWVIWVYQDADAFARSNLTFFLALSQVSTVFCLMTLRAAAMSVSLVATLAFGSYFSWADQGALLPQALVLSCVCLGMAVVTYSFNRSFAEVIRSRQTLRKRAIETEKLSDENRRIAFTDPLTGLANRRKIMARLDRLETYDELQANSLAVIFIDLDGFKQINDKHGHHAGDTLLRTIGQRLVEQCPEHATLGRVGGDEFTVILEPGPDGESASAQALSLSLKLLDQIALPVVVDRQWLQVSGSIGIAGNTGTGSDARELLRRADLAMYNAKNEGKAQVSFYSEALDTDRLRRLEIQEQISVGLERGEFDVVYQPIFDAQSGTVTSAEALLRWPRRPGGALAPDEFIEIAEAAGHIHPLGLLVLERACRQIKPLGDIVLSVNVSPAQFQHPSFETQVFEILQQTGFPPQRLRLEITESYLLANPARAHDAITAWKEKGITLALDDFGTGFTSIHYLRSYGFCTIKLDKTLINDLQPNSKAAMLVSGVIMLASALDMQVVAEGVEKETQASILRSVGCHELQGYLYGKPMPLSDFSERFGWGEQVYRQA